MPVSQTKTSKYPQTLAKWNVHVAKDKTLLAELCRLPQMHPCQGRGLQTLPPGTTYLDTAEQLYQDI